MMQNETLPACPRCGKAAQTADAAFCSYCGAAMREVKSAPVPEGALKLLEKAEKQTDPVKKHALLIEAQTQYPDCLQVAQELLFLGRLHERNPKKLDYSVIKSYLLHMYLTPEDIPAEKQAQMRRELFEHPDLKRCQMLAPDADAFTRQYLERLARGFISLFLRGSSRYMHTILGLRLDNRVSKLLASPIAYMLGRIYQDTDLSYERRVMLYAALYSAFMQEVGNDAKWVNDLLDKQNLPIPLKP